ncbi:ABC transporter ATP-binding protein [Profundibacter sp.]|uniref:ABC transporter ATP-binding protein n=1 Tax=Profundibacter sp. TaxID=3101071 RepID=UPI003D0F2EF0
MTALKLEKVCKSFGSVKVLHDIDLTVEDGEFVVFVGPSGCGKSTLLRVIAGLEDATSGSVEIAGRDVTTTPPSKRGIAMVFQSYALYPHLTVQGNMELGLKQARMDKSEIAARVAEASRMLSLDDYLDRRPAELSGGQRQRVAIGRAITREPDLFLFDEPLSNLDAALRMNTRIEIANLHRTIDSAMVYVTHDQIEAMTLADRIVVLRDGRVEQVGSPMDIYNDPDNQFVASFIGSPAMNFVKAAAYGFDKGTVLGIRPEYLTVVDNGRLSGVVTHIERLGAETNLLVDLDTDDTITLRLFGQYSFDVGQKVGVDFDDAKALFFDEHGQRIR